jgi:aarF domain-containing kinase
LPLACCNELNLLTQRAPEHQWKDTHRILQEEFKGDYTRSLQIKPDIIASASIAQVYEGTLDNRRVAVKVQHPNIMDRMAKDLILIETLTANVDAVFKTDYSQIFRQFGENLVDQLDFRLEKSNLEKFSKNFARWRFVKFPQPYTATERVLIESFEDGHSIIEYIQAKNDGSQKQQGMVTHQAQQKLASIGLSALLKMIISDNFIHADLHPGNILVRAVHPENFYEKIRLKIEAKLLGFDVSSDEVLPMCIFLDAGLATHIPPEKNSSVEHFFKSLLVQDGCQLAQSILTLSTTTHNSDEAKAKFTQAMEERTDPNNVNKWDLSQRTGECMRDALEMVRMYGIRLDTSVMVPFISAITLEGWQYELDPTVSVLNHVQLQVNRQEYLDNLTTKFAHSMWKASEENIGLSEPNPPSYVLTQEMALIRSIDDRYPNKTDVNKM